MSGTETNAPKGDTFDATLGSLTKDPRRISKLLGGCVAVLCIPLLGLGLLALLGFMFQTAVGTAQGKEHPMPEWRNLFSLLRDGVRLLVLLAAFVFPVVIVGALAGALVYVPILGFVLLLAELVVGIVVFVLFPGSVVGFVRSNSFPGGKSPGKGELNEFGTVWAALIVMTVLTALSLALCVVGIVPGLFCGMVGFGAILGVLARQEKGREPPAPA